MTDQNQADQAAPTRQFQPSAMPPFNLSRRYACDRCRRHKLRCVRDHLTTESPCQRCRKAREKCTIGASIRSAPPKDNTPGRVILHNRSPSSASDTRNARPALPQQARDSAEYADGQHESPNDIDINWFDSLDSTYGNITCDLDYEALGNGTVGEEHDADVTSRILTIAPAGHNTNGAAYPLQSAPEDFEFAITADSDTSALRNRGNIQISQQHHKATPRSKDASPSHQPSFAQEHATAPSVATSLASKAASSSGSYNQTSPSDGSSSSTAELKDEAIQELSDLSTSLMKDLHRVVGCKLASSFLLTCSDKSPAEYLFKTLDGSTSQENAIGRMLKGSEKFLEIMQLFNQWSQPAPSISDNPLDDLTFNVQNQAFEISEGDSQVQLERRWRALQSCLERQNPIQTALTSGAFGLPEKPDITSKLAVLTCYTCLLRIYETVFFVVNHTLEYTPSLASAIRLPQTVPGLEINGFMLHKHRSLQIKVLIQVSTYMLDSVEKSMHCMLSDSTFQALLKTVLRQEGLDCSPGNDTGMGSVRRLIEQVDRRLD